MKSLSFLLCFLVSAATLAQQPKTDKSKSPSFCEVMTNMKTAGEANFIALASTPVVETQNEYEAKVPLPGFDVNKIGVYTSLKMYYTNGLKYFETLDEAKAAFNKAKSGISDCFKLAGTDVKTAKQPHAHNWVSEHKDFMNLNYKIEIILAVFQNTKTNKWAVEYFMQRK